MYKLMNDIKRLKEIIIIYSMRGYREHKDVLSRALRLLEKKEIEVDNIYEE